MWQRKRRDARRRISGFLASVLAFVFVFEQFFVSLSYAGMSGHAASASDAVRSGQVSLEYKNADDVQMIIMSDEASYEAGDTVCLDVYIKNNTDQEISDGSLKFKAKGILEDSGCFEDVGTIGQELLEEMAPSGGESSKLLFTDGGADSEFYTEEEGDEGDNGEMSEMDEEKEVLGQLRDLTIAPGEVRYVQFYFTIDDSIEGNKSQSVNLTFQYDTENTRNVKVKETFRYAVGAMNLMPVEIGNQGKLEAGEQGKIWLDFELGEIQDRILEKEMESENEDSDPSKKASGSTASPAQAKRASSSNAWIKWAEDSSVSKKKEEQPIIKNLKCTVETKGVKLNKFSVEKQGDEDYGTSAVCTFQVDETTKPGIYYGEVTAVYQIGSKKFQTTQGFQMIISNDTMELEEEELEELEELDDAVAHVTALIEELPELEEVAEKLAALEDAGDDVGYFEYIMEISELAMPVWELYQALTDEQKEQVVNREKLEAYSVLWETMLLAGEQVFMISYPRGNGDWNGYENIFPQDPLTFMGGWKKGKGSKLNIHGVGTWKEMQVAYCIEPGVGRDVSISSEGKQPEGQTNLLTDSQKALIGRIISSDKAYNGAISLSWTPTNDKNKLCKIMATQLLVWEVVVGERADNFEKIAPPKNTNKILDIISKYTWADEIKDHYDNIVDDVTSLSKLPAISDATLTWNESEGQYQAVLKDELGLLKDFTVTIGSKELKKNKTITVDGISFTRSKNGNQITAFTKTRPSNTTNILITASKKNKEKRYGLIVWSDGKYGPNAGDKNQQDVVYYSTSKVIDYAVKKVTVTIGKSTTTSVTLEKKDAEGGNLLSGATFDLYKKGLFEGGNGNGSNLKSITTGENGQVAIKNLGVGIYTLVETKAPDGYSITQGETKFKVVEKRDGSLQVQDLNGSALTSITVKNTPKKTAVTLKKTDGNQTFLPGAEFILKKGNDEVGRGTTDANGEIRFQNLGAGSYTLVETKVPDGYTVIGSKETKFDIVVNNSGDLEVRGENGALLPGNIVTVTNKETAKLSVTKEVTYDSSTSQKPSSLEETTKETFHIMVKLGGGGAVIPQKSLTVNYTTEGIYSWDIKAGETITIEKIPVGTTYEISETSVPDYTASIPNNSGTIVGDKKGTNSHLITVTNTYFKSQTTSISGEKIWDLPADEESRLLPDSVTIGLMQKSTDGSEIQFQTKTVTADTNGQWKYSFTGLPLYEDADGNRFTYAVKEISINWKGQEIAPIEGTGIFKIPGEKKDEILGVFESSVPENTDNVKNTWHYADHQGKASFLIWKKDEEDKKPLKGAVFTLTDHEGAVQTETTDENGRIEFDDLDEGVYLLKETAAPEGYQNLEPEWRVIITKSIKNTASSDKIHWVNEWQFSIQVEGPGEFEQAANTLTVENKRIKAPIQISKVVELDDAALSQLENAGQDVSGYRKNTYQFSIYKGTDTTADPVAVLEVSDNGEVKQTEPLDYGKYTIVEETNGLDMPDYTWKEVRFEVDGTELNLQENGGIQVEIKDHNVPIAIQAVNQFAHNKANLAISKKVAYDETTSYQPDPNQEFWVEVQLGSSDELIEHAELEAEEPEEENPGSLTYTTAFQKEGIYRFGMKAEERVTITGIPTSMPYVVKEYPVETESGEADLCYTFGGIVTETGTALGEVTEENQKLEDIIGDHGAEEWTETITITNHYFEEKMITIEAEKSWKDVNNQDMAENSLLKSLIPDSIEVNLMRKTGLDGEDAVVVESGIISRENLWKHTFTQQPQYAGEKAETPYYYYVEETNIHYSGTDTQEAEYFVEPIEGTSFFKVMRVQRTNGFNEVLGVFEAFYPEAEEIEQEDGSKVKPIAIRNIWNSALPVHKGDANFSITKVASENQEPLAGATFEMAVGDVTMSYTTDENGSITFQDLPEGQYTLMETKAPEGRQKLDTQWKVTVEKELVDVRNSEENPSLWINEWLWTTTIEGNEENKNQLTVENDLIQGSVSIVKTLELDGQPVTDPVYQATHYTFGIYPGTAAKGAPIQTLKVLADGSAVQSGTLDYGIYTIAEISRASIGSYDWKEVVFGGVADADQEAEGFQVMIAEQDQVVEVTARNRYTKEPEKPETPEGSTDPEETTAPEGSTDPEETTAPEENTVPEPSTPLGSGGGGGGGGRDRDPDPGVDIPDEEVPLISIDPEAVPLANLPNEPVEDTPLVILDEDVPLAGLAKTGDRSIPIGALVGLMLVSLLGVLGVAKKRKDEEEG